MLWLHAPFMVTANVFVWMTHWALRYSAFCRWMFFLFPFGGIVSVLRSTHLYLFSFLFGYFSTYIRPLAAIFCPLRCGCHKPHKAPLLKPYAHATLANPSQNTAVADTHANAHTLPTTAIFHFGAGSVYFVAHCVTRNLNQNAPPRYSINITFRVLTKILSVIS